MPLKHLRRNIKHISSIIAYVEYNMYVNGQVKLLLVAKLI